MGVEWSEVQSIIAENTPGAALEKLRDFDSQIQEEIDRLSGVHRRLKTRIVNLTAVLDETDDDEDVPEPGQPVSDSERPWVSTRDLYEKVLQVLAENTEFMTPTEVARLIPDGSYPKIRDLILHGRGGFKPIAKDERFELIGEDRKYRIKMKDSARAAAKVA